MQIPASCEYLGTACHLQTPSLCYFPVAASLALILYGWKHKSCMMLIEKFKQACRDYTCIMARFEDVIKNHRWYKLNVGGTRMFYMCISEINHLQRTNQITVFHWSTYDIIALIKQHPI